MLFSRKKCTPDKNNKREFSGCKSTASFASLPIKSSNGERRSPRSLRSNCDKNVVSKEIAVLGGEVLERDGKEIPRPEEGSSLLIWTGSFPRVLSEQIFFTSAQVSLRGAASNFDRQDHNARVSPADNSLPRSNGENDPQNVLVEFNTEEHLRSCNDQIRSLIAGERSQSILPTRNVYSLFR